MNLKFGRRYRSSIVYSSSSSSISSVDNTVQTLKFVVRKFGQYISSVDYTLYSPNFLVCSSKVWTIVVFYSNIFANCAHARQWLLHLGIDRFCILWRRQSEPSADTTAYVHIAIKASSDCSAFSGDNFKLVHQKEEFRHKPVNIWTSGIIIQDDGWWGAGGSDLTGPEWFDVKWKILVLGPRAGPGRKICEGNF